MDDGFDDGELGNDGLVNQGRPEKLPLRTRPHRNFTQGGASGHGGRNGNDSGSEYELSDEYMSEELDSYDGVDSDSGVIARYPQFRKEELDKRFKFKLGMEFKSLEEFKKAILKYSVLHGREVVFAKNDKVRVRAVCKCKGNCDFVALVSRVGKSHTHRMRTLVDKHTCGRVFANKNAKAKWVAEHVMEKLRGTSDVSLAKIITDVRRTYAAGITVWGAWKAKKIAKEAVEGDAARPRQYNLLWRYCVELRRSSTGNTCRLLVERPCPTLSPRSCSFYFCFDGCKKGFLAGCRPFIGVDGCHLKTKYGGQLLVVVGRDPND